MTSQTGRPFGVRTIEDLPALEDKAVLLRATLDMEMDGCAESPMAALRLRRLSETVAALRARGAAVTVCGDTHAPGTVPDTSHDRRIAEVLSGMRVSAVTVDAGASIEDAVVLDRLISSHDIFINDSFQWSYLPLPSLTMPAERLPSAAGRGLQKDLHIASSLLSTPARPFAAVLGGANSMLRLHGLQGLVLRADVVLIGGPMSLPMLEATGKRRRGVMPDWFLAECRSVIGLAERVQHRIHLPLDVVVRRPDGTLDVADPAVAPEDQVVDIGPLTVKRFAETLHAADTVVWTGALGRVEDRSTAEGTLGVAAALEGGGRRVVIGGDCLASLLHGSHMLRQRTDVISATDSLLELFKSGDLPVLRTLRDE